MRPLLKLLKNMQKKLSKNKILVIDSTLRDGSHALRHQFTSEQITTYAKAADAANTEILMVGHGNGLGASSLHLGLSKMSDTQMLKAAKKVLKKTKLGAFLIPGFGTIEKDLKPAIACGIQVLMVATHCTEANIARQHIEFAVSKKLHVYGVLMMSHMLTGSTLLEQAKLMQEYGANGVLLMDSAGNYLPHDVTKKVSYISKRLAVPVGFHAHNNLGMAVANSLAAVESGATIIDATSAGLGAGAGNCQLEVIASVLESIGYKTGLNTYRLMDNSEYVTSTIMVKPQEISSSSLVSGLSGVFSGFLPHAKKAALHYNVDIRDIMVELGRLGIVAGQEDIVIHTAAQLSERGKKK